MGKKYNILVIGCGSIGQRHARLLSQRTDTNVYIADTLAANVDACKKTSRIEGSFADYKDALEEGMDGAFICTPNDMHVKMALDCLQNGTKVLIEKPVSNSVAEAQNLFNYEKVSNEDILVGYTLRFSNQIQEVKNIIDRGQLGNIVYANASVYTYATLLNAKTNYREKQEWTLVGDYTHEIDLLRYLIGDVNEVFAMAGSLGDLEHKANPNIFEIMLKFENMAIGNIHMDYVRDPEKRSLEIIGDKGSLELYINDGILRLYKSGERGFKEIRTPLVRDDLFIRQIENFIGMIRGEEKPRTTLKDGISAIKIAEAAIKSCVERRIVNI